MPWARASSLHRFLACPAASWLPRWDREKWQRGYLGDLLLPTDPGPVSDSSAADWGTAMHDAKSNNAEACDPWLSAIDSVRERYWPSQLGVHEQAYAYSCKTGLVEIGPVNLPVQEMNAWKESRPSECVTGTADWAATLPSGEPWVDDLKTGWKRPPTNSEPMLFYGLCQHRTSDSPDTGRLSITHYPRVKDPQPDQIRRYWLQVTAVAFEAFADEVNKAWHRTKRKGLDIVRPGPHCEYCPSQPICPGNKE